MKRLFGIAAFFIALAGASVMYAQDTVTVQVQKRHQRTTISLGSQGLRILRYDSTEKTKPVDERDEDDSTFSSHWVMMDLGFNAMVDKSDYNSVAAKNFLNVPASARNSSLFDLRSGKSINVNIFPFMETYALRKTKRQQINISTGLGLQLYNFRYENPVTFTRNPDGVVVENTSFKKDKLAFDYLTVPLMFTFKTRMFHKEYIVYGIGITGGYNLSTWTKQESGQYGKVKVHDNFDFATFNSCLEGEIGIFNGIRFYGTYQLTNLYSNSLNQHPICVGVRFFAI